MVLAAVRRGAFFGALSDNLRENAEYTRKKSDAMQEYLWTAGLNRRNEVKKSKVQLQEAYDYLTGNGLDEDKALGLLDTDPKEMLNLYKVAQKYKLESGRLSSNILNSAVTMAQGYEAPDMTASELINKAAPDFIEGAELDPPAQERSFLGKLFGTPSMDEIRYDVYSSEIMGRKGSDIMASISAPTIRARDAAGGVDTDYTGLGALDPIEIGRLQSELEDKYVSNIQTKIDELRVLEGKAQRGEDGYSNADLSGIIARKEKLLDIQDLGTNNQKMIAAMQNPDLGFGLAQEYYRQYPQIFIDRPTFINNNLLPFISGDETYNQPTQETNQERNEDDETTTPPPTTQVPLINIQDYQNPKEQAEEYFRNNPEQDSLVVVSPDGSEKRFRKIEIGDGRNRRISIEEVG